MSGMALSCGIYLLSNITFANFNDLCSGIFFFLVKKHTGQSYGKKMYFQHSEQNLLRLCPGITYRATSVSNMSIFKKRFVSYPRTSPVTEGYRMCCTTLFLLAISLAFTQRNLAVCFASWPACKHSRWPPTSGPRKSYIQIVTHV